MDSASSLATVVVVPRERFSCARASLDSLLANTSGDVPFVYVDGGGPKSFGAYLASVAGARTLQVIRRDYFLSPNEARNIGLAEVRTKYVAFVDNDVIVTPGWLEQMVECAEAGGAAVVGPLYLEGKPEDEIVHMAGGEASIKNENGVVTMYEQHRAAHTPLARVKRDILRGPTEVVEFHCMVVRRDIFETIGALDEDFLNTREHVDFCLTVAGAGGRVFLEPAAAVTYLTPPPFSLADIPFYLLRWSEAWSLSTLTHAKEKWRLTEVDTGFFDEWLIPHRRQALMPLRRWVRRCLGEALGDRVLDGVERRVSDYMARKRPAP